MTFTDRIITDLDPVTDRPGWLAWRRSHVGASDVAGILGISPWASPWSVWADKCGLLPEEPQNEAMEAGRWLESAISPWFTHRTGLYVIGHQAVVEADDGLGSCTADGFVVESESSTLDAAIGLHEVKTTGPGRQWEPIPAHYQAQAQWSMYVTGLDRIWFAVLMGRRLDVLDLDRDDSDIAFMVDRVNQFWADHVVTGTPPPTDGSDATLRAIEAVYPNASPDKSVELDDLAAVFDEWTAAKAEKSAAEKREKEAKAAICAALEDAEEGTISGERVVSYREQTRKSYTVEEATFRVLRVASRAKKEQAA